MTNIAKRLKVIAWISISLVGLVAATFLFSMFNPMQAAFLTSFEVTNQSGRQVWITPIGQQARRAYGPLPRFRDSYPPMLTDKRRYNIPLAAGETIRITYDWDDINFRYLLIRAESQTFYILGTDRKGTTAAFYPAQQTLYRVPPLGELAVAPRELEPCAKGRYVQVVSTGRVLEPLDR